MSRLEAAYQTGVRGFETGFAAGRRKKELSDAAAMEDRKMRVVEGRESRVSTEWDLDAAVREKKRKSLESELDLDLEMKRDAIQRFADADDALSKFESGMKEIDWGAPDAGVKYEMLGRQYLPSIVKDSNILKKWEVLDRVNGQSRAFIAKKSLEQMTLRAMEEASQIAPELALDPPKREDGSLDLQAFSEQLSEARKRGFEESMKLREISAGARRAPVKKTMGPGAKAELGAIEDELRDVNKRLNEPKIDPDSKLKLVSRKSSLLKQLRMVDEKFADSGDSSDGESSESGPAEQQPSRSPAGRRRWNPETGALE